METNEEYGPEIETPGNEMPDWLEVGTIIMNTNYYGEWDDNSAPASPAWAWENIPRIRLRADHPYYARMNDPIQSAIALLEQNNYTVTAPDPMIKDREFVAGLERETGGLDFPADVIIDGDEDNMVRAIMAYLRANKEKI